MYAPDPDDDRGQRDGGATDGEVVWHVPEDPSHGRLGVRSNRSSAEEGVDAVLVGRSWTMGVTRPRTTAEACAARSASVIRTTVVAGEGAADASTRATATAARRASERITPRERGKGHSRVTAALCSRLPNSLRGTHLPVWRPGGSRSACHDRCSAFQRGTAAPPPAVHPPARMQDRPSPRRQRAIPY